jgi:hypothetical protein
MHSAKSVLVVVAVAFAGVGCSDSLAPELLRGNWAAEFSVAGNSSSMTLTTTGNTVTGTGAKCGEASICTSFTITGTVEGNTVHLDFLSSAAVTDRFVGTLPTAGALRGFETIETTGQPPVTKPVIFHRFDPPEPI